MAKEKSTVPFFSMRGCVKSERVGLVGLSEQKDHERDNLHLFIITAETIH